MLLPVFESYLLFILGMEFRLKMRPKDRPMYRWINFHDTSIASTALSVVGVVVRCHHNIYIYIYSFFVVTSVSAILPVVGKTNVK
jgi:hypothetical protein